MSKKVNIASKLMAVEIAGFSPTSQKPSTYLLEICARSAELVAVKMFSRLDSSTSISAKLGIRCEVGSVSGIIRLRIQSLTSEYIDVARLRSL